MPMDDTCAQCQEQFDLQESDLVEVKHGTCNLSGWGEITFFPDGEPEYIHQRCASRYFNPNEEDEIRAEIREEVLFDGAAEVNAYLGGVEKMQRAAEEEMVMRETAQPKKPRGSSRGGRWRNRR